MFVDTLPSVLSISILRPVSITACNGVDLYVPVLSTTKAPSLSFVSSTISLLKTPFSCLDLNVLSCLFVISILSPLTFASTGIGSIFLASVSNTGIFSPLAFCIINTLSLPITSLPTTLPCCVPSTLMFTTSLFLNLGGGNNFILLSSSRPYNTVLDPF